MASTMAAEARIGVIGGSGLYRMPGLANIEEVYVDTPFGMPSDAYVLGEIGGRRVAFLPRHGRQHRIPPHELNFRANIYGFKKLGVEVLLSASAVGSMKETYEPTHIVVPDQFIDRTRHRPDTFFGDGVVAHIGFADPICKATARLLYESGRAENARISYGGVYLCIEGPQFSTRAESALYRAWGVDVIGMTNLQEAKLAREAEICYATLALVTDFDCWHETAEAVSVEAVVAALDQNAATAQAIMARAVASIPAERTCPCASALAQAMMTAPEAIPLAARQRLHVLLGKYLAS